MVLFGECSCCLAEDNRGVLSLRMFGGSRFSQCRIAILLSLLVLVFVDRIDASSVDCSKPPLEAHPKDCCHMPPLLDETLLHGCKQLHGGEHLTRGLIHERGSCFIECALNSTGTLVNGVLDQQKIVQLITSRTAESGSALTAVMVASCVKCFLTPQVMAGPPGYPIDSKHCRPTASIFVSCVNMEMFKMCLPEFWVNSDSCNNLRLHITNCPIPA